MNLISLLMAEVSMVCNTSKRYCVWHHHVSRREASSPSKPMDTNRLEESPSVVFIFTIDTSNTMNIKHLSSLLYSKTDYQVT